MLTTAPTPSEDRERPPAAPIPLLMVCVAVFVAVALNPSHGNIAFLRWMACFTFLVSTMFAWFARKKGTALVHAVAALTFNPFWPPHLSRELWIAIDIAAAVWASLAAWLDRPERSECKRREKLREFFGFFFGFAGMIVGAMTGMLLSDFLNLSKSFEFILAFILSSAGLLIFVALTAWVQNRDTERP